MKKLAFLIGTSLLVTLTGCSLLSSVKNKVDFRDSKVDSTNWVSKQLDVEKFSSISSSFADLVFTQSPVVSVVMKGDSEQLEKLNVSVKKGVLKLYKDKEWVKEKDERVYVYISSPELRRLHIDGVGDFSVKGGLETDEFRIEADGVSDIDIPKLKCESLHVQSNGVGDVNLSGNVGEAFFTVTGVGDLFAKELRAENVKVSASGVGDVECYASRSIDIQCSGVGDVAYYGKPSDVRVSEGGVGDVKSK